MIELNGVSKIFYKNGIPFQALTDVSLFVPEGKVCGVIGASGAGKSTLIRCVNLLERPSSGDVKVANRSLLALDARGLADARSRMGMIFQGFNLLSSATVIQNIALPLKLKGESPEKISARVTELLGLVGLKDKADQYPAALSGGQKQRVAIARALAGNPTVLLCDEATSALDPATTRSILALLKNINRRLGITILLITHEMDVVRSICDDVAVIDQGRLVEQGTVSAIFARPSSPVTRSLILSSLHADLPETYRGRLTDAPGTGRHPLVQIEVSGVSSEPSLLTETTKRFGVDNHIVSGKIESAGEITFGVLIVQVRGNEDSVNEAIRFFKERKTNIKILGYV